MQWFFAYHHKIVKGSDTNLEMQSLFNELADYAPKPPRSMRMTQYYSKHYYATRIKAVLEARWLAEQTKPLPDGEKRATRITVTNSVTKELWEGESDTFRKWLVERRDVEHQKILEERQKTIEEMSNAPESAQSYHM